MNNPADPGQELIEFVNIIETPGISKKDKQTLLTIAAGFLQYIEDREAQSASMVDGWVNNPAATGGLIDPKTQRAVITSKAEADTAAAICNELAASIAQINASTAKETSFFHKMHSRLTSRRNGFIVTLNGLITKLKNGNSEWLRAEQQRIRQEQERIQREQDAQQAKIEKKAEKAGVPPPPPPPAPIFEQPKIAGMADKKVWRYRVPQGLEFAAFVKAIVKGSENLRNEGPLTINDDYMKKYVALNHDAAVTKNGKKYLFGGSLEIYEDTQMSRR